MGQISVFIDDDLDAEFRATIANRLGLKKGNIKIAIEDAIRSWIDQKT